MEKMKRMVSSKDNAEEKTALMINRFKGRICASRFFKVHKHEIFQKMFCLMQVFIPTF